MSDDPHTRAVKLSAGTLALQGWVAQQAQHNTSLSPLERLALGHIPLDLYGQIVTVVLDATDPVATPTPPEDSA